MLSRCVRKINLFVTNLSFASAAVDAAAGVAAALFVTGFSPSSPNLYYPKMIVG